MEPRLTDNPKFLMLGVWSLVAMGLLVGTGWFLIAGLAPPYHPSADAPTIAGLYQENYQRIRIGNIMLMFGAMLWIPFVALLARLLAYVERGPGVLTYIQIISGTTNTLLFFYPGLWWLTASFRPERSAELLLLLNDIAYLQFIGGLAVTLPMLLTLTAAAFFDKSKNPVFPRWFGYLSAWVVVLFLPGQLIFFVKTGPFAWNGLMAFWIPALALTAWIVAIVIVLRKSIKNHFPEYSPNL